MATRKIKRRNKKVRGGLKPGAEAGTGEETGEETVGAKTVAGEETEGEQVGAEAVKETGAEEEPVGAEAGVEPVGAEAGAVPVAVPETGAVPVAVPETVPGAEAVSGAEEAVPEAEPREPTEEQIEKEEKEELKKSLDDALKEIPFVGEIIDKNPVAGHAITLFKSVFPSYSDRLTNFLSDEKNKEAINGIISEMSKPEFANNPTKQAEFFSSKFGEKFGLNKEESAKFTPDDIMSNVNTMKDQIKTTLNQNSASSTNNKIFYDSDPEVDVVKIIKNGDTNTCVCADGGKRKSKKLKKSKSKKTKSKKTKSVKKRTHKKSKK